VLPFPTRMIAVMTTSCISRRGSSSGRRLSRTRICSFSAREPSVAFYRFLYDAGAISSGLTARNGRTHSIRTHLSRPTTTVLVLYGAHPSATLTWTLHRGSSDGDRLFRPRSRRAWPGFGKHLLCWRAARLR
jgi:hypothetical protein